MEALQNAFSCVLTPLGCGTPPLVDRDGDGIVDQPVRKMGPPPVRPNWYAASPFGDQREYGQVRTRTRRRSQRRDMVSTTTDGTVELATPGSTPFCSEIPRTSPCCATTDLGIFYRFVF